MFQLINQSSTYQIAMLYSIGNWSLGKEEKFFFFYRSLSSFNFSLACIYSLNLIRYSDLLTFLLFPFLLIFLPFIFFRFPPLSIKICIVYAFVVISCYQKPEYRERSKGLVSPNCLDKLS